VNANPPIPCATPRMRRRLLSILAATLFLAAIPILVLRLARPAPPIEVQRDALTLENGQWHRHGDPSPFSGMLNEYYETGILRARSRILRGVPDGISEGWYPDGRLQIREHFQAGVSHGPRHKWHPNGRLLSEATIVQGRIEGVFRRYHEDGSLAEEIPMRAGLPEGWARSFYPSGFVMAEASLRDGQVLERHDWKDEEHRVQSLDATQKIPPRNL